MDVPYGDITFIHDDIVATDCVTGVTVPQSSAYECRFTVDVDWADLPITDTVTATVEDDDGYRSIRRRFSHRPAASADR